MLTASSHYRTPRPSDCGVFSCACTATSASCVCCILIRPCIDRCAAFEQALQQYFDNTWVLTESLFAGLQGEEAFMFRPLHELRHPLIFYYGHVAALYVNKLRSAGLVKVRVVWSDSWREQTACAACCAYVDGLQKLSHVVWDMSCRACQMIGACEKDFLGCMKTSKIMGT